LEKGVWGKTLKQGYVLDLGNNRVYFDPEKTIWQELGPEQKKLSISREMKVTANHRRKNFLKNVFRPTHKIRISQIAQARRVKKNNLSSMLCWKKKEDRSVFFR
jgi:hypothetical protein